MFVPPGEGILCGMNERKMFVILAALVVLRLLVAAFSPVFETSEARYAAISANMARTGDYVEPAFTYKGRYQSFQGKPPLLFQTAALGCEALGVRELSVRLPVLLATLLLLVGVYHAVAQSGGRRRALFALLLCGTSVAFYAQCGFCMMDGLLTAWVGCAYVAHYLLALGRSRNWSLVVFGALALGVLTKGPVALALFCGPVLVDAAMNRRWNVLRAYRWISGTVLFLAVTVPWFCLMQSRDSGFLDYFFIHENLLRFLVHDYGDRYGAGRETFRGMALVWAFVVTLPWCIVLPAVLRMRLADVRHWFSSLRDGTAVRIFDFGILCMTAFWCLTSRVPLAYLMPIVPLCAVSIALALPERTLEKAARFCPHLALTAAAVLVVVLSVVRWTGDRLPGREAEYRRNRYSYEFYHGTPAFAWEGGK